jgi:hypothetical protein
VEFGVYWGDELESNGNQADVGIHAQLNDVRTAGGAAYDPNPGFPGDDITLVTKLRLTDSFNGPSQTDPATVRDFEISVPGRCDPFPGSGSHCLVSSAVNAVTPGVVTERKHTVLQVFRVRVNDSGANGTRGDSDDRTVANQGIYIP